MSFNAMKESLGLLVTLLENVDTIGDPQKNDSLLSSVTAQFAGTISLIESSEQAIIDLSQSLCDTIQRYLALVNSSISSHRRTVVSLPNEIMVEIFQLLVVDGSHHLQPLLLVNKQFHALVTSAPSLWCNINLVFDEAAQECNNLSARYIQSCIKYSGKSFLNIDLNLADISYPSNCAMCILRIVKEEVPRFSDVIGLAIDIVGEIDWLDEDAFFVHRLDKLGPLTHAIAGENGVHTRRWRSFKLFPPEANSYTTGRLWPLLKYEVPNLETFVLQGSLVDDFDEFYVEDPNISFPKLVAVRHLTLNNTSEFQLASFSRHLLTTAVINLLSEYSDLDVFSGCGALQELTIDFVCSNLGDRQREKSIKVVELPSLKKLKLGGSLSALDIVKFQTPCLDSVTLLCGCERGLPKLRARSVTWMPFVRGDLESMEMFLRRLLGEIKETEEIVLQCKEVKLVDMMEHAVREIVAQRDAVVVETPLEIRIVSEGVTVDVTQIGNG